MKRIGWPHPTVRLRLTLTYTTLFVVTGAALLGVSYILVQHREKGAGAAVQIICTSKGPNGLPQSAVFGPGPGTGSGTLTVNPSNCPNVVGSVYHNSSASGQIFAGGSASGAIVAPATKGVPIPGPTAAELGRLTATVKASQAQTLKSFKVESALALGLLTLLSFGLSWWIAGRALRPVHRITDAARSLSERTLHARINLQGPNDELKQLADTFDSMLGRLDRAFNSQRRFVANASHELRTPLATERVLIDEALANRSASPTELRSILEQLRLNSEETERLIDALLVLARSERGVDKWTTIELSTTAAVVVDQAGAEAAVAGVTIDSDLKPVPVSGDAALIERLAGNLVENAIRHNLPSGSVWVTTGRDSDVAVLRVANTGPWLDPEAVPGLVEPFRRAGHDRSSNDGGLGLGLSIVDAIVSAHRGTMTVAARHEGGLDVTVHLPVADPSGDGLADSALVGSAVTALGAG
ncbi:MAG TPA: HAMP domain-containing sensor histidine kinase [Acidimicrobiales bacterium]|nr:HAMP domain-containing sensor histidine kinase [Acidimicrobiales bacterium]